MNTIIAAMTIAAAHVAPAELSVTDDGHIVITDSYEFVSMCLEARSSAVSDVEVVYAEDCLMDAVDEILVNGFWIAD